MRHEKEIGLLRHSTSHIATGGLAASLLVTRVLDGCELRKILDATFV